MAGTPGRLDGATMGSGRKTFVPLENNPAVMTRLARQLGLSDGLEFHDVYSLDDPDMLCLIPRPVHAILFTCPASIYSRSRLAENERMQDYDGFGPEEPVMWFKQTIGNACGLIALLHALSNGCARAHVQPSSPLDQLFNAAVPLDPSHRAQLLYNSPILEASHQAAAQSGDSAAPNAEEYNLNHFICFVKAVDGHLWELNGGMKGPVDRGVLGHEEDVLSRAALSVGVNQFLDNIGEAQNEGEAHVGFSIIALAAPADSQV